MPLLSLVDMHSNLVAVAVVLVLGIVLLHSLKPRTASKRSRIWLPIAAFLCGPLLAFAFFLADVFVISRDYITTTDYTQALVPVMVIGFIAGVIGAVGFWIGDVVRFWIGDVVRRLKARGGPVER